MNRFRCHCAFIFDVHPGTTDRIIKSHIGKVLTYIRACGQRMASGAR